MIKAIQLTANFIAGQLWGKEGQEARNFLIFHGLNLLWGIGEMFATLLFHPLLMMPLVTIIFLLIPEFRIIGFGLVGAYVFTFISMRFEAKRYRYEDGMGTFVAAHDPKKEMNLKIRTRYCKYSGYKKDTKLLY